MTSASTNLLRRSEVERRTGLSRSSIYRLLEFNRFPRPIRIGDRTVAWVEGEIDGFISARIAERDRQRSAA